MDPFAKPPTISDDFRMAEIYRQSSEVFHEKGFQNTSMAEIAESVDLTQGGLYYYIKGKKALLYAIMSYALDLLETEVVQPVRRLEAPAERFEKLVEGYLRLITREPSVMTTLAQSEEHLEPPFGSKIRSRKRLFTDLLRDAVAVILYDRGGPRPCDAEEAVEIVMEMIHTVRGWNQDGHLSDREAARRITDRALDGLSPQPWAAVG